MYLQGLSLLHQLGNPILTSIPCAAGVGWLLWKGWKKRRLFHSLTIGWDVVATAAILVVFVWARAVKPPSGFDVLAYHFPYTVSWIKLGWAAPFYTAFSGPVGYYPGILELLTVPVCNLTSSGFLYNGINLFSFALLAGCVAVIAKRMELRPSLVVFFLAVFMLTSKVNRKNLGNGYTDLFLAAAVITSVFFLDRFFSRKRFGDLAGSALMMGIAVGTKYAGLLYGGVFLIYVLLRSRPIRTVGFAALFMAIPGLFWYLRNLFITGSPVYPQGLGVGEFVLFPGQNAANATQLLVMHLADPQYLWRFFNAMITNGHLLFIPLLLLFFIRRWRHPQMLLYWRAGWVGLILYMITPLSAESINHVYMGFRYALPFFWLTVIAGGISMLTVFPLKRLSAWLERHTVRLQPAVVGLFIVMFLFGGYLSYHANYERNIRELNETMGGSWAAIDRLRSARVAYIGMNAPGPLYGRDLQHEVVYVNVNTTDGANYHVYGTEHYRGSPEFAAWLDNLKESEVDYLWVFNDNTSIEKRWISEHPDYFAAIYEDENVTIYNVIIT